MGNKDDGKPSKDMEKLRDNANSKNDRQAQERQRQDNETDRQRRG